MKFLGLLFLFFYRCRRHYLMGVRLDSLGILGLLLGTFIAWSQNAWTMGGVLLTLALTALFLVIHTGQKGYIIFQESPQTHPSSPLPVYKADYELALHASGHFAIRDKVRYLANHPAILTTPPSREHVLMVRLDQSRYMLLGKSPSTDWGWWYQFIPAAVIDSVLIGTVTHGWRQQPALKVSHRVRSEQDKEEETVVTILSFENKELLTLAWANLTREMREHPTTG
jgi:hypothetical protein